MRVLVVDDDNVVTMSLKMILEASGEVEVIGTGGNGADAVELYRATQPEVLLMDIQMNTMNGLEAAEVILAEYPNAAILFLTTFSDDEYIVKALSLGVKGYILKQDFESILPALRAVRSGQSVFGRDVVSKLPDMMNREQKPDFSDSGLSEKELQVVEKVADGQNNKEIAETLFLSEGTVRNYISVILEKLGLRDRTQLAIWYLKRSR
ncbi:MAG: response regulator transcription factor [Lachnospiraceae bacterium]|nr:response regulator transcription factor [Lachnospiraceae bacterium]